MHLPAKDGRRLTKVGWRMLPLMMPLSQEARPLRLRIPFPRAGGVNATTHLDQARFWPRGLEGAGGCKR
eukprot:5242240-Pyramimonas_sp.AAC.1